MVAWYNWIYANFEILIYTYLGLVGTSVGLISLAVFALIFAAVAITILVVITVIISLIVGQIEAINACVGG